MKILLVLILICGMGYVIYIQHEKNAGLTAQLNSSKGQLEELQKKYEALQRSPGYVSPAGAAPKQQSGAWMRDPNHASPLGTPSPIGKSGGH